MVTENTHFQRALVLYRLLRWDEAKAEFIKCLSASPNNAVVHAMISQCLSNLGRPHESLKWATKAVELNPESAMGFYALTLAYLRLSNVKKAFKAIDTCLSLDSEDPLYHGQKSRMLLMIRGDLKGAQAHAEAGLRFNPRYTPCLDLLAESLLKQGRDKEAQSVVEKTLSIDPQFVPAQVKQGWEFLRVGRHVEALDCFRESLRLDPHDTKARVGFLEAIKSQNWFYRSISRVRMSGVTRPVKFILTLPKWAIFTLLPLVVAVGFTFLIFLVFVIATEYLEAPQGIRIFIRVLAMLLVLGLALVFLAKPMTDILMVFHRQGRHALPPAHLAGACALTGAILWAIVTVPLLMMTDESPHMAYLAGTGLFVIPTFSIAIAATRHRAALWCLAGIALATSILLVVLAPPFDPVLSHTPLPLIVFFSTVARRVLKSKKTA